MSKVSHCVKVGQPESEYTVETCIKWKGAPATFQLDTTQKAVNFVAEQFPDMRSWDRERAWAVVCDAWLHPLAIVFIAEGLTNTVNIDISIMLRAITAVPLADAAYIMHNHPTNYGRLSRGDYQSAGLVKRALLAAGITPLDDLAITGDGQWHAVSGGRSK